MIRFSKHIDSSYKLNYQVSEEKGNISFPEQIKKSLKLQDILVVDYLYQNYIKQLKGAILNEEVGFNSSFQVSVFLNRIFCSIEQKFLVLVLTSEEDIIKWHYHLIEHSGLRVQIIGPKTCPADFDQEHGLVLLLPFQEIKLAEALVDYSFFSVVIDQLDKIATKLIVRKLQGEFNIGLSSRDFYSRPDQKLQWTMLNWSNPGVVGKLNDFYNDDSDNFSNLRDNYHHWWFTLTWGYCDNFHRPTETENLEYRNKLCSWAVANGLNQNIIKQPRTRKVRVKKCKTKPYEKSEECKQIKSEKIKHEIISTVESENPDSSVKKEDGIKKEKISEAAEVDISEKEPYLNIGTRDEPEEEPNENISGAAKEEIFEEPHLSNSTQDGQEEEPNNMEISNGDDILLSIINEDKTPDVDPEVDHQSQLADKKKEIMSDIFDDDCSLKNESNSDDSDFLLSLI